MMYRGLEGRLHHLVILFLLFTLPGSRADSTTGKRIKTMEFLSPKIELEPGSVVDKFYDDMDFPRGHVALKSFNAEVVDDKGNPIPLHETYIHHWAVGRYFQRKGVAIPYESNGHFGLHHQSDFIFVKNSGLCETDTTQYFGLGSETRKTSTYVQDPYGIEVGNPADIPNGYEEKWLLNVHAIDTRGAEEKLACTECRCDLYNVTVDKYGWPLPLDYVGGLKCCYDDTRCRVKEGFQGVRRSVFLKYTVKFWEWDDSIVPVNIYVIDVTDKWIKADASRGIKAKHHCQVEHDVDACPASGKANLDSCIHIKTLSVDFPNGGHVIYAVAHLHSGGIGAALYGEDGRGICSSYAEYGKGHEAGNEAGYIVGMSTCYPSPGSVKIYPGETLTLVSNYSSAQGHTGVMGFFYLLIAESSPKPSAPLLATTYVYMSKVSWVVGVFGIVGLIFVVMFMFRGNSKKGETYEPIIA